MLPFKARQLHSLTVASHTLTSILNEASFNSQGGKTLLMVAAEEDKRSVVAVLLKHNAMVDLTDAVST